jgi:plastocyanin
MFSIRSAVIGSLASVVALATPVVAQDVAHSDAGNGPAASMPHTIVIKLIERPGAMPFAFEPATVTAHHGDTLRFVQFASTMHNVHFKTEPKGAKLGSAATSQYLTTKGQAYTLVVDSRFVNGTYEIVCDPHELIGMHAFLSVTGSASVASGK